jgi:flagellar basal-body rod modification protein FlgD
MATSPISPTPSVTTAQTANLNLNDLLTVLLTELTHQDPLKPVDNTEFMAQIAQFASLDATQQTNQNVQQLVGLQALNQTVGLMGRTVSATLADGTTVNGQVIAVAISNGTPEVTVQASDGTTTPSITIGEIQTIRPASP